MTSNPFNRYQPIIHDWCAFTDALSRPLPTCIWANTLRITAVGLAEVLRRDGIEFEPLAWLPGGFKLPPQFQPSRHWAYLAGLYHVQEEVSLLPVTLLNPQPGERVLDLCAAPGGKTAQISVAMAQQGTVLANDINMNRMRAVRHAVERLGLANISTTVCNGANFPKAAGLFDRVLVDAPCSCEGTTRKTTGEMTGVGEAVSHKLSGVQRALLRRAVQLCRPGGRVVYATCTYAPEENEHVVDAIVREFGEAALRLLPVSLPNFTAEPGLTAWAGQRFHPSLRHALRVWPHQNDTGGFFVAVLEKQGDAAPPVDAAPPPSFPALPPPLLAEVVGRYGIALDERVLLPFQSGRRRAYLVSAGHLPPAQPTPDATGLLLAKTAVKFPKLSTAAAMLLGATATRNFVDVDAAQARAYFNRQQFAVTAAQTESCLEPGYVLVRHQGFTLGVGVFFSEQRLVASLFPKAWAPGAGNSEFLSANSD